MSTYNEEQTQAVRERVTPKIEKWLAGLPEPPPPPPPSIRSGQPHIHLRKEHTTDRSWSSWLRQKLRQGFQPFLIVGNFLLGIVVITLLTVAIWAMAKAFEGHFGSNHGSQEQQRSKSDVKAEEDLPRRRASNDSIALSEGAVAFLES